MRGRLFFFVASPMAIFLAAPHAIAQDAASATVFLRSVYRQYENGRQGIDSTGPYARLYFHSSLSALMRADEKAAAPEIGALDGDPICSCQDFDGVWDLAIDVHVVTPQRAIAKVSFALYGPKDRPSDAMRRLEFTLIPERGQWRIFDVVDRTDPSQPFALRQALRQDIAAHSHPKK